MLQLGPTGIKEEEKENKCALQRDRRNKWLFGALSKNRTRQKEEKHEEIYTEVMLILLITLPCRIFRFESP
jgi:hypothetical protein